MSSCDIIIPVWNQLEATRDCVDSLALNTDYPYRLIIIDNGSDESTRDYIEAIKNIEGLKTHVIRNDRNTGFVKAVNQGMRQSDAPYLCIMNNDTIAMAGWLGEMIKVMENRKEIGILNPSSNTFGQSPGSLSLADYASSLKRFTGEIQELYTCRGFCMLLRREVVKRIGLLDEAYEIGYFEETDYCRRAQAKGIRVARAKAAYVYHSGSLTFKKLDSDNSLFKKNEVLFLKRWGRTSRIAYLVDGPGEIAKIDEIAKAVARSGNQIIIFLKKGLEWPVTLDHIEIRRLDISSVFFGPVSLYGILKRKRKKKIDIILTDNRLLGGFSKMISGIHGSDVVVNPIKDKLLKLLKERSWKVS